MKKQLLFLALFSIALIFAGCTSSTLIQSEPTGAKVFLNESYVGQTPYLMSDQKISMMCTAVRLEKDGYEPLTTIICRDEDVDGGAVVGGIFLWFPWLWVFKYAPQHDYILKPTNENPDLDYYYSDDNQQNVNQQPQQNNQGVSTTKAQKLLDLKKLLDQGVLTQEEYDKEKQKILDQDNW